MPEQDNSKGASTQIEDKPVPTEPISSDQAKVLPGSYLLDDTFGRSNGDKPKWTDIAMAFFTICLVIVSIIQGHIFYKQWQEMHSGGVDTHDLAVAAKSQADAAIAQANEAKEQVGKMAESLTKTDALIKEATAQAIATNNLALQAQRAADYAQQAIKTSVESERPWVGVSTAQVANFVEGQTAKITINVTNSGKRPASAKEIYGASAFNSLPLFPTLANNQASVAYILPGASSTATFEYIVPDTAFSDWKRTKQIFFVYAEIVYTDVGTNTSYITHFCEFYNPDNKDQPFSLCTRYNEAK